MMNTALDIVETITTDIVLPGCPALVITICPSDLSPELRNHEQIPLTIRPLDGLADLSMHAVF